MIKSFRDKYFFLSNFYPCKIEIDGITYDNMEEDVGIFSVPYHKISDFKELLLEFYETNNSQKIKEFFKEECLTLSSKGYELLNKSKDNDNPDSDDFIGLGE